MHGLLAALEATELAHLLRRSLWLYPLANVLHVLGLMGFFAVVAAMDVKALRAASTEELRAFIGRLRPAAVGFLLVQVLTGVMLFLPEASHIGVNPAFLAKLALIAVALGNVAWLETALARSFALDAPPAAARVAAGASLALWLAVAALGRLIAYL